MHLTDLFSEVVEVDTNPYKLQIEEVTKVNGELKRDSREEIYNLIPYNHIEVDIINHILQNSENQCLQKSGNFLKKMFSKHPITKIEVNHDEIVISCDKILSKIKCDNKITHQIDELIIAKKGRLLINTENKLFYINSEDYKVYSIK